MSIGIEERRRKKAFVVSNFALLALTMGDRHEQLQNLTELLLHSSIDQHSQQSLEWVDSADVFGT